MQVRLCVQTVTNYPLQQPTSKNISQTRSTQIREDGTPYSYEHGMKPSWNASPGQLLTALGLQLMQHAAIARAAIKWRLL